jgi:hypothetical protein
MMRRSFAILDTARWLLGVGWPKHITSTGGVFVDHESHDNLLESIEKNKLPAADIAEGNLCSTCCVPANLSLDATRPLA